MTITINERVGKALQYLRDGMAPFVDRELHQAFEQGRVNHHTVEGFLDDKMYANKPILEWDAAGLLSVMLGTWQSVFSQTLGNTERSYVFECKNARNRWAHQEQFSSDDADRAMDTMERLLTAASAVSESAAINKLKTELRRIVFEEQARNDARRISATEVKTGASMELRPWREVVTPHPDVASGRFTQAEFAADLWQVHLGEGADEYRDAREFFRRTYLTQSLRQLLENSIQRIVHNDGDPVVQLQTNFGGGKTHSMLALFHLYSGTQLSELAGLDAILTSAAVNALPAVKRVVLVGNKISSGNPDRKPDGTVVRTLWGELAWQLGGASAYERIRADDEHATNPGDKLRELLNDYGPSLILIDEWVAYARQLHDRSTLPGGGFETQFSFAQALTEAAKLARNCLLVISLPASDSSGVSPHAIDDVEVGGVRGREALDRLRNVIGRVGVDWRPANPEEGFEIVRRRLFEPITGDKYRERDATIRLFGQLYQAQRSEFPPEASEAQYEQRMRAAYPIHPEIFDRLYGDWATLVTFQRTRGVLRLMASVIYSLWQSGDRSPLIMPASIPIDDNKVQFELTRYLSDQWIPIIEKDIDGVNSLPRRIDSDQPNLGRWNATRRVARTIYLGSAPATAVAQRGIEDRRVKLGCIFPGENTAIFGDALRRLSEQATYLYSDNGRSWYDTKPTVTKLADDRAELMLRNSDQITMALEAQIRTNTANKGRFNRVHSLPAGSVEIPDDTDTRLVVLRASTPHRKEGQSLAIESAKQMLSMRGNSPRSYQNSLVFLAADATLLPALEQGIARMLAWESIIADKEILDLTPAQVRQADLQQKSATESVKSRIPEVYQWLLVPTQPTPQSPIEWNTVRMLGNDQLAVRVGDKLLKSEGMNDALGATILRHHLDVVPLWREGHVSIKSLVGYFASYPYLPRLINSDVLLNAIISGTTVANYSETFATADRWDATKETYVGLRTTAITQPTVHSDLLLVQPARAAAQLAVVVPIPPVVPTSGASDTSGHSNNTPSLTTTSSDVTPPVIPPSRPVTPPQPKQFRRYHGTKKLNIDRVGREANQVIDDVIKHLTEKYGVKVQVTIEISAEFPEGVDETLRRTINENSKTLNFDQFGFEEQ